MNRTIISVASGLMSAAILFLTATPALADRPRVEWSISIGAPGYYPPAEVYVPPQAPAYVAPYPVYEMQAPYQSAPRYDYYEREWAERQWREQQWREQRWRERHWRRHHGHH